MPEDIRPNINVLQNLKITLIGRTLSKLSTIACFSIPFLYCIHVRDFFMVSINNDMIEMLTSREQLMEDIDAICDEFFCEYFPSSSDKYEELVRVLCDSVCKNFPTK